VQVTAKTTAKPSSLRGIFMMNAPVLPHPLKSWMHCQHSGGLTVCRNAS